MPRCLENRWSAATITAIALAAVPPDARAEVLRAEVLDALILPETRVDDIKVSEISGIAWDRDTAALWAITDKAKLIRFSLDFGDDRIARLEPVSAVALTDKSGARIDNDHFNPEGIAILNGADGNPANAEFLLVSERGPAIARFSSDGRWLETLEVPEALRDPSRQKSEGDGLEALTIHPVHGIVTLPEEPLTDAPRRIHTLFASDGATFQFSTEAVGNTSVKALETLADGRILILDRMRSEDKLRLVPFLSIIDPATCPKAAPCPALTAPVIVPDITNADFESIAEVAQDRFLMMSDDEIDGARRTVVVLVELTAE